MKAVEEFKGTKGMWDVLFVEFNNYDILCVAKEDTVISQQTFGGKATEEMKANAHLIAAAPDLLDALIETDKDLCVLEGNIAQIEKSDPRAEGMTTLVSEWRKRNRKAINKALGK